MTDASRRYGPLIGLVVALLLVVAVLPSALNQPQSNPTTTPEYAPVPPSDKDAATPPGGNLAQLGLASAASLASTSDGRGGPASPEAPAAATNLVGRGKSPTTKHCVGQPPRQTEDPMAPPCVADFRGENGGATYGGVTREEVRVLVYAQGGNYGKGEGGVDSVAAGTYADLNDAPSPNDFELVRILRGWQSYFNDRYQTYGRVVHLYAYFNDPSVNNAETRRADAADNYQRVQPFAVLTAMIDGGNEDPYIDEMARRGVMNFGSFRGRAASLFSAHPTLIWGFFPSTEQQAAIYTSYVCRKVVPYPVSFSGNALDNGKPRALGLLYSTDPRHPELVALKNAIKSGITACGGTFADEESLPFSPDFFGQNNVQAASQAMATFVRKGVTTVIWALGLDTAASHAAAGINYRPEWVIAGENYQNDATSQNTYQEQSVWAHAWVVTNETFFSTQREEPCFQAYRSVDPNENATNISWWACGLFYGSLRQLFTAIQVAGPRLGPDAIDRGFHAIPHVASANPRIPACFYDPGDYTCVKDAVAEWWNSTSQCWMMTDAGKRYLREDWPAGDVLTQQGPKDFCNNYSAAISS